MPYYRNRYWRRSGFARRYSVQKSQQQGTRRFKVSLPVDELRSVDVSAADGSSKYFVVVPLCRITSQGTATSYLNTVCWANLMDSKLFRTYCQIYDEVRIVGVRMCVSVMGYPSGVSAGGVKIVSCIDRRGNREDMLEVPTTDQMLHSADSLASEYTSLERAKQYRSVWARDLIERNAFYDSTINTWNVSTSTIGSYSYECNTAWRNMGSSGFAPMFYYRLVFANKPATDQTCSVSIKANYTVEFRNPKWSSQSDRGGSRAKFGEMIDDEVKKIVEKKEGSLLPAEEDEVKVSEDSVLSKRVKFDDSVPVPDDDVGMSDESSQPQLTKEELLEMLKKYDEKKS